MFINRFLDVAGVTCGVVAPLLAAAVALVVLRGVQRGAMTFGAGCWQLFGLWVASRASRKKK